MEYLTFENILIFTFIILGGCLGVYLDKKKKGEEERKRNQHMDDIEKESAEADKAKEQAKEKRIEKKKQLFNEIKNHLKNEEDPEEFENVLDKYSFISYGVKVIDLLREWSEILGNYNLAYYKNSTKYEIVKFAEKKLNLKLSESLSKLELIDRLELKINELSKESKKPDKIEINKIKIKILKEIKFFHL